MHLAHSTTKGVDRPPKPPLRPNPGPTCIPYKQPARPGSWSKQGKLLLVFTPSCCSKNPNKALPEFLAWPLINFYWLRRPRTLVSNILLLYVLILRHDLSSNPFEPLECISASLLLWWDSNNFIVSLSNYKLFFSQSDFYKIEIQPCRCPFLNLL